MANVKFYNVALQSTFDALETKEANALYFIQDTQRLYHCELLMGTGALATNTAAGLLSAEDYKKLQDLIVTGGTVNLSPINGTITIEDNKIGVAISTQEGNALVPVEGGLFVPTVAVPAYAIERQETADDGYAVSYKLKKTVDGASSYVGDVINVPKDLVLKSATLKTVVEVDVPYAGAVVGDPYIHMVFNDAAASDIYVPVKGLVDTYTAGAGIEIVDNVVGVKIAADAHGLVAVEGGLSINLATADSAGAMSAADKVALDKLVALDIPTTYGMAYEISNKPVGTLVNYNGKEIRVMCPADTNWALQNVGEGGDSSKYYIGFRAYAPSSDVVSFKESLDKTMTDQTMYYFEGNDFAGIDANGRKYSIVWLPVAQHNDDNTWTYYGAGSTSGKLIGWYYSVEWYDASGVCIASDLIKINLANENCVHDVEPYYMSGYVTDKELEAAISDVSATMSWSEM